MTQEQKKAHERLLQSLPVRTHKKPGRWDLRGLVGEKYKGGGKSSPFNRTPDEETRED